MRTFTCTCGNSLFFGSTSCLRCSSKVGLCPSCRTVGPISQADGQNFRCGSCQRSLTSCGNQVDYGVCNGYVTTSESTQRLCTYCRLNSVIPDVSFTANLSQWRKLELAKRRVLFSVEELGYPINNTDNTASALTFAFKSENVEPVSTGHLNGCITISLREADEVEREKTRVEFGEPQRTLVGHVRHELGHYYWDLLVNPGQLEAFRQTFGDETNPTYRAAQQRHYADGPPNDWQSNYISAYASMHPWEDFSESFGAYLDMAAVLGTANHFKLVSCDLNDFDSMVNAYLQVGIAANELNRDMGLLDLVPELFPPAVIEKLKFVHNLRRRV